MPERSQIGNPEPYIHPDDSPEVLRAKAGIIAALKEYPLGTNPHSKDSTQWAAFCQAQIEKHGDNSLITAIPDTNVRGVRRILRLLIVNHQVATREALINMEPEKINELKQIGPRSAPLIFAMRNLSIAQLQ